MPFRLPDPRFTPRTYDTSKTMRTFHHDLHTIDQTTDDIESLGNGHLRLLSREPIESLEDRFDFVFSKHFLYIFLCYVSVMSVYQ